VVDSYDVASSGFDLHGVAYDLLLVVVAAEDDARGAFLDEGDDAVFEFSSCVVYTMKLINIQ
jgi:hypothetical protein